MFRVFLWIRQRLHQNLGGDSCACVIAVLHLWQTEHASSVCWQRRRCQCHYGRQQWILRCGAASSLAMLDVNGCCLCEHDDEIVFERGMGMRHFSEGSFACPSRSHAPMLRLLFHLCRFCEASHRSLRSLLVLVLQYEVVSMDGDPSCLSDLDVVWVKVCVCVAWMLRHCLH